MMACSSNPSLPNLLSAYPPSCLTALPLDVMECIAAYFSPEDLVALSLVNKALRQQTDQLIQETILPEIQRLADKHILSLERESPIRTSFEKVASAITTEDPPFTRLNVVTTQLAKLRQMYPVVKEGPPLSALLDGLVEEAKIRISITAHRKMNDLSRYLLCQDCRNLVGLGLYQQALQISATLGEDYKNTIFAQVARAFTLIGRLDDALQIAKSTSEYSLVEIVKALVERDRFDKAINIAHSIPHEYDKSIAFKNIARGFARAGRFDEAIAIVPCIPDVIYQQYVHAEINECRMDSPAF